jgi:hypothetical protein
LSRNTDSLVIIHIRHALNLLGVLLRLLRLWGNQPLKVLHLVLQVCCLSLTGLKLLVPLVQLGLEVVDVALGSNQLILSMLQSGTSVIKVVSLEVAAAISHHQLITQLPDARLEAGVLLQKLSVALLDILYNAVLGLYLIGALLQPKAQVSTRRCDLLKQGAHVLGVACGKRPTRMVGQKLGVADGGHTLTPHRVALIPNVEQGKGGVAENQ